VLILVGSHMCLHMPHVVELGKLKVLEPFTAEVVVKASTSCVLIVNRRDIKLQSRFINRRMSGPSDAAQAIKSCPKRQKTHAGSS
jgi:hypothetical protein